MKVLILGGSGFVGSHISDIFINHKWSVTVFDRSNELFRKQIEGVAYISGDFGNRGQLEEVVSQKFNLIVHCISSTTPKTSNDDPEYDIGSNLIETVNLLDICVRHKTEKIIFLSSGGTIYGDSEVSEFHGENDLKLPICSYAITKLAIENYLYMYSRLYGLKYTTLRISNPYGPRQNPKSNQGAVAVFIDKILSGAPIEIWGDGEIIRDFIYVSDVANACYLSAISSKNGIYNIGSGVGLSLNKLINLISKISGHNAEVVYLKRRDLDINRVTLNCEHARDNLQWSPTVDFEEGIEKTIKWIQSLG